MRFGPSRARPPHRASLQRALHRGSKSELNLILIHLIEEQELKVDASLICGRNREERLRLLKLLRRRREKRRAFWGFFFFSSSTGVFLEDEEGGVGTSKKET